MKPFWKFRNATEQSAELLLYGPISETSWWGDEVTPRLFADELKALGSIRDLSVRINSGGGDVFAGMAIFNLLRAHQATVTTIADGIVGSIASVVFQAGDRRVMPANTMQMVHNPAAMLFDVLEARELRGVADWLDQVRDSIIEVYSARTGKSRDEMQRIMNATTWMLARDAVTQGFADEVEELMVPVMNRGTVWIVNNIRHDLAYLGDNQPRAMLDVPEAPVPDPVPEPVADADPEPEPAPDPEPDPTPEVDPGPVDDPAPSPDPDPVADADPSPAVEPEPAPVDAVQAAIAEERARILAIDELAKPGRETLLAQAKAEGWTAADTALAIVKAEGARGSAVLQQRAADATKSGVNSVPAINGPVRGDDTQAAQSAYAKQIADQANKQMGGK